MLSGYATDGTPYSFNWVGTLEVLPNCAISGMSVFKINGIWYDQGFPYHSCGSPFYSLRNFTVTCEVRPNGTPETALNPLNLAACESGVISGAGADGTQYFISFGGVVSLEPTCDQAGYSAVLVNGSYHTANLGFRNCGSPVYALRDVAVVCDEANNCAECCRSLLPIIREIRI